MSILGINLKKKLQIHVPFAAAEFRRTINVDTTFLNIQPSMNKTIAKLFI